MNMNTKFRVDDAKLDGVKIITPFCSNDNRGSFIKDYSQELLETFHVKHELKEVFYTVSHKGVIRAIHFQREKEQAKLVRCIKGKVFDVVVDLRYNSPTFGQWNGFDLNEENQMEILIPEHFGHGYLVLEDAIVSYKCAEKFYGEFDDGILWNDPDIAIDWPIQLVDKIILSEKDKALQSFKEFKQKYAKKS